GHQPDENRPPHEAAPCVAGSPRTVVGAGPSARATLPPPRPEFQTSELGAQGDAHHARGLHDAALIAGLEGRVEGEVQNALVGQVADPELKTPALIQGADADAGVHQDVALLYRKGIQILR